MKDLPLLELWYAALREPLGIVVITNDAERLRTRLYAARREAGDPQLENLSLIISPENNTGELWIAHRMVEVQSLSEALSDV